MTAPGDLPATDTTTPSAEVDKVHCEHAANCGGCTSLDLSRAERAQHKRQSIVAAFAHYPWLSSVQLGALACAHPELGYRTRAKLVVAEDGRIGLYGRGTHEVLDIPGCRVVSPDIARALDHIRASARRAPGQLLAIDVREVHDAGGIQLLVTLIGEARARAALERMAHELSSVPGVIGVAIGSRERRSPNLLGATPIVVSGPQSARDRVLPDGPYCLASHGSFVQAHRGQAAALARRLLQRLEETLSGLTGRHILELYAGSGALGLALCSRGARPLLIERFAPALSLALSAAQAQGLTGLQTIAGDATRCVADLVSARAGFDAAIVNPPRRGLPAALRCGLAALAPPVIAYASCDPHTLARDLNHFALLGYRADAIEAFDMIPLTDGVECLAVLTRASPPPIAVLYEDDAWIAVDKPPHLPTTPQGEQPQSLLATVHEQLALPQLNAVHRLDRGTSGICLFAKHGAGIAPMAAALAAGEKNYLALVRGITRDKGSIRRPLTDQGTQREARTRYARVEVIAGHSLLRVRPDQGRTHQVRRHLASIGHPLLGDDRYGDSASNRHFEMRHGLDRPFLHLARIQIEHPTTGAPLCLESALAGDLATVFEHLRRDTASLGWST